MFPWKQADVKPRLKKPSLEAKFTNLRPIRNLSFALTLAEQAVLCQMHDRLTTHKLYTKAVILPQIPQYQNCSFVSQEWYLAQHELATRHLACASWSHCSFQYCWPHNTAWSSLQGFRHIRACALLVQVLPWQQIPVSINGGTSKSQVKYCVPQRSCLGPLLFALYVSKLFKIMERHLPDVHAYADNTQQYISFNADSSVEQSAAVEAMQNCIADIRKWILQDRLSWTMTKLSSSHQLTKSRILAAGSMDSSEWTHISITSVRPQFFIYST